jgi:hypothetical protein
MVTESELWFQIIEVGEDGEGHNAGPDVRLASKCSHKFIKQNFLLMNHTQIKSENWRTHPKLSPS